MKYIFTNTPEFEEPIRVLFLCGTKYSKNDNDKRVVLKKSLEQDSKNRVIILEEYYNFNAYKQSEFLSYYNANLFNLYSIEMLVAAFSNQIIIIHESYSTAGEIGAFAGNPYIRNKIITISPERYSVDEEKVSGFLSLAFWNFKKKIINNNVIRFYPIAKKVNISPNRSTYYTFFKNDELPQSLSKRLASIIEQTSQKEKISIKKVINYQKSYTNKLVHLDFVSFKNYFFALYTIQELRDELRECKKVYEITKLFKKYFLETMKNTVIADSGICDNVKVLLNYQYEFSFEDAISMMVYIMNACNIIHISVREDDNIKVQIPKGSVEATRGYAKLLKKQDLKEWGE